MGLIRLYQLTISPLLNMRGPVCRFYPSCSHYGYEAIATHGAVKGTRLTIWRLVRCNPWNAGGYDPVPPRRSDDSRPTCTTGPSEHGAGPNTSALGA